MSVLISMAGLGSRFSKEGFKSPKYKIKVRDRSLFEWSMLSLGAFRHETFIFACLSDADTDWIKNKMRKLNIPNAKFYVRESVSTGQAETVYDALGLLDDQDVLWVYNIDTYVEHGLSPKDMKGADGCLHVFHSSSPNMSFVGYDSKGFVAEVAEKRPISTFASVGCYGFSSVGLYKDLYEEMYQDSCANMINGERYIAPMYNVMLARGLEVLAPKISQDAVHILGTPDDIKVFANLDKLAL